MFKNVASQKIALYVFDSATGLPKTGDAGNLTFYVAKDHGTVTALTDTSATERDATNAKGWYVCDLSQAETNGDQLLFTGKSSTTGIVVVGADLSTLPPNFSTLVINTAGAVTIQARVKKNTALRVMFQMTDSSAHNPATGKTVTVQRSLDAAAFGATSAGTATELSDGWYYIDLIAGDLNANVVALKMTASGCDQKGTAVYLEP